MPKTVIRTPFPSPVQVAEILGLSKSRVARLDIMMNTILGGNGDRRRERPGLQAAKKKAAPKKRK
jgi:hypothetical protein